MYVKVLDNIIATLKRGKGGRSSLFSAIWQGVPSNFVQDCRLPDSAAKHLPCTLFLCSLDRLPCYECLGMFDQCWIFPPKYLKL